MLSGAFDWLVPMGYEHPERAWYLLLIPLGIALYVLAQRLRSRHGMRYTNTGMLERVLPRPRLWLRHLAVVASLLSLITLTIAYMIPQAADRVPRERATVVIVLDISRSMGSKDVAPTRFEAAKQAATDFVNDLPQGYNVALVSLSGSPSVRMPPTTDHSAVNRLIAQLQMQDSTALGDSIYAALAAVDQAPLGDDKKSAPASIVLLSDGGSEATLVGRSARQAAAAAKQKKVPIYTVAYGTDAGYVDLDGKREPVKPDRALMSEIAQLSGGQHIDARSADDLRKAYQNLQSKVGYDVIPQEVTARWAGLGLVLGFIAALAATLMAARWP